MGVLPWTVGIFRHCKTTVGVSPGFCGLLRESIKGYFPKMDSSIYMNFRRTLLGDHLLGTS